jgi:hypothetical protein
MKQNDQRKHPRHNCGAVIQYAVSENGGYLPIRSNNVSEYGMGFVAGYELRPGSQIRLTNRRMSAERGLAGACTAEVVWCQPLEINAAFSYRVGVRFDDPSHRRACLHWQDDTQECKLPT